MFNGLIRETAEVVSFNANKLCLKAKFKPKLGDSIAVNGACLSVVEIFDDGFCLELSHETQKVIAIENIKNKVHIEPAMQFGDRIDGHLIQGHIDGCGKIANIKKHSVGTDFFIDLPSNLLPLVANKGSIAIDGVSLTINEVLSSQIRLTIIPQTMKDTLFSEYKIGRKVNIETDLLARYTQRILSFKDDKDGLTWEKVDLILGTY